VLVEVRGDGAACRPLAQRAGPLSADRTAPLAQSLGSRQTPCPAPCPLLICSSTPLPISRKACAQPDDPFGPRNGGSVRLRGCGRAQPVWHVEAGHSPHWSSAVRGAVRSTSDRGRTPAGAGAHRGSARAPASGAAAPLAGAVRTASSHRAGSGGAAHRTGAPVQRTAPGWCGAVANGYRGAVHRCGTAVRCGRAAVPATSSCAAVRSVGAVHEGRPAERRAGPRGMSEALTCRLRIG